MKLTVKLHSDKSVEDATKLTNDLKIKNLRGVKVRQQEAEPTEGALDIGEYLPYIKLIIESGLATAALTQIVGLLKNGFFTTSKKIASDERLKNKEIEANERMHKRELEQKERIEKQKIEAQNKLVELNFECKDKKFSLKFTKDDSEQQVLAKIERLMAANCR